MKLTPNPHEKRCEHHGRDEYCRCEEVWSAAVKATLEDVARDLEAVMGASQSVAAKYAQEGNVEMQEMSVAGSLVLQKMSDRYRAKAKEVGK